MSTTPKTAALSFRVPVPVAAFLESVRRRLGADKGGEGSASMSDAARFCIAQCEAESCHERDIHHLSANRAQSLAAIDKKIREEVTITPAEWLLLAFCAADAYSYDQRSYWDSALLAAVIRAFDLVWKIRAADADSDDHTRLYLRNLISDAEQRSVEQAVELTLSRIEAGPVTRAGAEFLVRNLEAVLRDGPSLPADSLDRALQPYREPLFMLAARGYCLVNGHPWTADVDNGDSSVAYQGHQSVPLHSAGGNFYLSLLNAGDGDVSILLLFQRRGIHKSLQFREWEDTVMAVMNEIRTGDIEILRHTPESEDPDAVYCWLTYHGCRLELTRDEFYDLKGLVTDYLREPAIAVIRERARRVWGAS